MSLLNDGQELPQIEEIELPSHNDLMILEAIGGDSDAQNVSFQGIKRKLGLHQETLSRSLHRLQRDGYVERVSQGYRISSKGRKIAPHENSPKTRVKDQYPVSILKAMLPDDIRVQDIVSSLSYRWFGNLRWLGFGESEGATTMSWITSDSNLKITVKIFEDSLNIESYASNSESITLAIRSAYELFDHITKVFKARDNAPSFARAA
ncbi:MAG: MarR family transcriptional regulator [Nitrososphaerales archaeon]